MRIDGGSLLCACLAVSSCAARPAPVAVRAPTLVSAQPRIVTPDEVTTQPDLVQRAQLAMEQQRWRDAARDYGTLAAVDPDAPETAEYLFNMGLAFEGCHERERARDAFLDVGRRFAGRPRARAALVRAASLDAYLEDWEALREIGDVILAQKDVDDMDRLVGLGARGLGAVALGDDRPALRDVLDGLEIADHQHYGPRDVLPVAVAELHFALGEVRRVRAERVHFPALGPAFRDSEFLAPLEERCGGLLEAQAAYAAAVRSVDPHWAEMAGYRVAAMYQALHEELMQIEPPIAKTDRQRQIFYAFMHVRYRVLLEKGLREIEQTIALGQQTGDSSPWVARAMAAKEQMAAELAAENARIAHMPFTEAQVELALGMMKKRAAPPASSGTPRSTGPSQGKPAAAP